MAHYNHRANAATLFLLVAIAAVHSTTQAVAEEKWCVAKKDANSDAVQGVIDWVCGNGVNCQPIQRLGQCSDLMLIDRASFVMNSYYQAKNDCNFKGIGVLTSENPSRGACIYLNKSSVASPATPTPSASTPVTPTPSVPTPATPTGEGKKSQWCVAKKDANNAELQKALDWACGNGADCGPIQKGGACFEPNTAVDHASFAFNSYFKTGKDCNFNGMGILTTQDPSRDACKYKS